MAAPVVAATAATAASVAVTEREQLQMELSMVRQRFSSLEAAAQLSDLYQAIGHLDSRLTQLPLELNELRNRGYIHAGQLEDQIAAVDEQWDSVRPQVEAALRQQVGQLNQELRQVSLQVARVSVANRAGISAANTAVSALSQRINAARNTVRGLFSSLDNNIDQIDDNMDRLDWMLDQFESSKIDLRNTEAPSPPPTPNGIKTASPARSASFSSPTNASCLSTAKKSPPRNYWDSLPRKRRKYKNSPWKSKSPMWIRSKTWKKKAASSAWAKMRYWN